jgi:hypothetical protein
LTGKVATFAFNKYGHGARASRAIIVVHGPVTASAELPEPDATTIVYVQEGGGWRMYPARAPMLKRTIRVEPLAGDPKQTLVLVELSNGARQGFGIWWLKSEQGDR